MHIATDSIPSLLVMAGTRLGPGARFPVVRFPLGRQKGEDDSMSSDPSVSPDQTPTTSAPAPDSAPAVPDSAPPPESAVKFTRAASLWSSLTAGFLILIVLLIFITQNTESATLTFFGWRWTLPLGVAILLAAVGGGLITVLVGTARIFQLRRAAKKNLAAR
jgi:uncharacterized integral membrane protein